MNFNAFLRCGVFYRPASLDFNVFFALVANFYRSGAGLGSDPWCWAQTPPELGGFAAARPWISKLFFGLMCFVDMYLYIFFAFEVNF